MVEILDSEKNSISIGDYDNFDFDIPNDFNISLSVVRDGEGKQYLKRVYENFNCDDQKKFFRDLVFSLHCVHPLISKFTGYTFFEEDDSLSDYVILSEYPKNGFLMDYIEKSKKEKNKEFNNTKKSIYLFGVAIIGTFLKSRGISHRCFAPPSLGVNEDLSPTLLMFGTSKSLDQILNETIQTGNFCWIAPELEDSDTEISEDDYNHLDKVDVFSFGSLLYYLYTEKVPFYSDNIFEVSKKKKKLNELRDVPEDMRDLLQRCWDSDIRKRPRFNEIALLLQSHKYLFPGTDLVEFDKYVKKVLAFPCTSNISDIAPEILEKSVNEIYSTLITDSEMMKNADVLNALYTIREQIESYTPIILQCKRAGSDVPSLIKVPSFIFVESLKNEIRTLFGIPPEFQIIELENNKLADKPYLTISQLKLENGSTLKIYNMIAKEEESPAIAKPLKLNIPGFGNYVTAFTPKETVAQLIEDVNFLTRIPTANIQIKSKGKVVTDKNKTLIRVPIKPKDKVDVEFSYTNKEIEVEVDLSGVIGKSGSEIIQASPITKISTIMKGVGVDPASSFAVMDGTELTVYKALEDYNCHDDYVKIELNTIIPDEYSM